jgi:hypothetical protein
LAFEGKDKTSALSYTIAGIMILISFIIVPLTLFWLVTRESEMLEGNKTIEFLRIDVNIRHKSNVYFYVWFVVRRFLYIVIGIYSNFYAVFQI